MRGELIGLVLSERSADNQLERLETGWISLFRLVPVGYPCPLPPDILLSGEDYEE